MSQYAGRGPGRDGHQNNNSTNTNTNNNAGPGGSSKNMSISPSTKFTHTHIGGGHNGGSWNVWTSRRNNSGGNSNTNTNTNTDTTRNHSNHNTRVNSAGSPSSATYQIPSVTSRTTHSSHSHHSQHSSHSPHSSPSRPFLRLPPSVHGPIPTPRPPLPLPTHSHVPPSMRGPSPPDNYHNTQGGHGHNHSHIPHGSPPTGADYARGHNGTKHTRRGPNEKNNNQFYTNGGSNGGSRNGSNNSSHSHHSHHSHHSGGSFHNPNINTNNTNGQGQGLDIEKIKNDAFECGRLHGYQEGHRSGSHKSYHDGHRDGHREGHAEGHSEGHKEGLREGQKEGHRLGYKEGHRAGQRDGLQEGRQAGHHEGHQEGHQVGYQAGYYQGHFTGHNEGYDQGYDKGHGEGYEEGFRWASTFWTPVPLKPSAPEFVPGQKSSSSYTSPLVVDGSSGPNVDPTKFRKWLNDVEYRKLTRPTHASMANSSVVAVEPTHQQVTDHDENHQAHHDPAVNGQVYHSSGGQVEHREHGNIEAYEPVDNYAVQTVETVNHPVDQYDGQSQLIDFAVKEHAVPQAEESVDLHVGQPIHTGAVQNANHGANDKASPASEQLIDLDSPKAVEDKAAVTVAVGDVDKANDSSADDLFVTPHEKNQVDGSSSFDPSFNAKVDMQLDQFCQTLSEQMMNDVSRILDQHDQDRREERLQQFADLRDRLLARADDLGVDITKELGETVPGGDEPDDTPELMVDTTPIGSPVRSTIRYPSPASTPGGPTPGRPQIICLSRPQSPESSDSSESVDTVIHKLPELPPPQQETVTKFITFGEIPVTITKKVARHAAVKPESPPAPAPAPAAVKASPSVVEAPPPAVVESPPHVAVKTKIIRAEKTIKVEDDYASDTATIGAHSTAAFELLDDDTPGPVEPAKVTPNVIHPFPAASPHPVAPSTNTVPAASKTPGFFHYKKKKGKGKKKAKKAQAKAASPPVVVEDKAEEKTQDKVEALLEFPPVQPRRTLKFEDISIFSSDGPEPTLRHYQSTLYRAQPMFEIGPDQAPQITESYPTFRNRPRQSSASAYRLQTHQVHDPIVEIHDKNGMVFPVGGRTAPRGIIKQVPDHIVYKFGIPPASFVSYNDPAGQEKEEQGNRPPVGTELLARCVQHGLSTCPMCAITPSFRFLGPGESVSRTLEYNGKPAGDAQTSPAAFWRFRPAGFSDFEVHGRRLIESSISAAQHPDEANPFCHIRMMPQYDAEVLGHHVRGEHTKEKPLPPSDLDMYCCDHCGGLTWLVTRRSRPNGGGGNGGHGGYNGNNNSSGGGDRTFGKQHPSHHATFNETWSRSQPFCRTVVDGGRGENRFPEQAGTTRSMFIEVASVPAVSTKKKGDNGPRFGLAAYFGANSRHNSRLDLNLATASMQTARDVASSSGRDGGCRTRLVDLPFEQFTINAGPIAAVAVALHRLWMDVVPMHRSAIDQVTRYNSDHSRRKAYRFRAIIMTDSQYVVDLFSDNIHKRWKRKFKPYEDGTTGVEGDNMGEDGQDGETPIPTQTKPKKKNKPKKRKSKKQKEEGAKKRAEEEEAEQALLNATNGGQSILVTVVNDEHSEYEGEGGPTKTTTTITTTTTAHNPNKRKASVSILDDLIDLDLATRSRHHRGFSISTTTPTSSRSNSRSRSHSPPAKRLMPIRVRKLSDNDNDDEDIAAGGLFAPFTGPATRDELDFDRPDGRFIYASQRSGPPLSNGILVQLVRRYIELLRWHGVQVALYEVDAEYVQGARRLAAEVVE